MLKSLTNYIFELGTLKKFEHCGFKLAGIKHPDTIAEHAHRAAIIGYLLAKMEKANAEKVLLMTLIHDNAEARITDLHKVAQRYINSKKAESEAFQEQSRQLPSEIGNVFFQLFSEFEQKESKEAIIAKDADHLETAFQAKEYLEAGYTACLDWMDNVEKTLRTESAKKIFETMKDTPSTDWWKNLKNLAS